MPRMSLEEFRRMFPDVPIPPPAQIPELSPIRGEGSPAKACQQRGRQNKYNAKPTVVDGIRFASKREAARYVRLRMMEDNGLITGLELQPRYPLNVGKQKVADYVADFRYTVKATGATVVEDAKGVKTPVYRLKKKMVAAQYGIEIHEV